MKDTTLNTLGFIIALFIAGVVTGGLLGQLNYHASWSTVKLPLCFCGPILTVLLATYIEYIKDGYSLKNIM